MEGTGEGRRWVSGRRGEGKECQPIKRRGEEVKGEKEDWKEMDDTGIRTVKKTGTSRRMERWREEEEKGKKSMEGVTGGMSKKVEGR